MGMRPWVLHLHSSLRTHYLMSEPSHISSSRTDFLSCLSIVYNWAFWSLLFFLLLIHLKYLTSILLPRCLFSRFGTTLSTFLTLQFVLQGIRQGCCVWEGRRMGKAEEWGKEERRHAQGSGGGRVNRAIQKLVAKYSCRFLHRGVWSLPFNWTRLPGYFKLHKLAGEKGHFRSKRSCRLIFERSAVNLEVRWELWPFSQSKMPPGPAYFRERFYLIRTDNFLGRWPEINKIK